MFKPSAFICSISFCVHAQRGRLVDGNHHRLALEAPAGEMPHDVLRHRVEAIVAGDEVVLARQLLLQPRLLLGIELRALDQVVDLLVQVRVDELQLGRAVLVVERHRGAVLDRLLEVVDRDVVAEDLLRPFLARDQRRAGEGEEQRLWQRRAHVHRQRVVLTAVRLVGEHDHVRPVAQHLRRLELVDQREYVAVVLGKEPAQLRTALRVAGIALRLAHRAARLEGLGDLVVEFHAVGHHDEGPVARHFAQDLLRVEHHREALARSLRLPEHPAAAVAGFARFERRGDGVVHPEILVVLRQRLYQPALVLREQGEVLGDVEQPRGRAGAAQHHLQRHPARLVLALDALPVGEPLPIRRDRPDPALRSVRGDQERIEPEELRNAILRVLVARQVLIERLPRRHPRLLQLDHHPRQPVHEPDQIRPARIELPGDRHLRDQQEIVRGGILPIHHPHALVLEATALPIQHHHLHAVLQQRAHLAVRSSKRHRRPVAREFIHRTRNRLGRQLRIQLFQRRA